ncbi:MAG: fructokinase [Sneathiella sp.]|nr:MAG: fructokinase [Sneathiella sp.]
MRIGVDLGGTKMEAIALSDDGEKIARRRIPTPRGAYFPIAEAIRDLVLDIEREAGATGSVGVGIPGAVSRNSGLIKNANTTELIGQPLREDLQDLLKRPIRLANDANCFVLSEATDGAAQGSNLVFGIILGTGVGGGIVIDGKVVEGPNAITGEWGHTPLPWATETEHPGLDCYCGKKGCIETLLSGSGLSQSHATAGNASLTPKEIVALADVGDASALKTLCVYEHRLAKALTGVINILDPDIIVVGGGLSNITRLYQNIPTLWQEYAFSDSIETQFVKARHGDSSGVRGAAWLWPVQS